ncbi:hypothetical protein PLANPX_1264 [Lacipirellula parvula]|uniref:Uncharacterized protein n=1 Tax=Lacipirellula parvula TaxID=2650471 RepID=A0A5K7X755_9BACT|nr:hypothetical protein PLANPX_1264 [Lacipirellula parvula]
MSHTATRTLYLADPQLNDGMSTSRLESLSRQTAHRFERVPQHV